MKKETKWILTAFLLWKLVTVVSLLLSVQLLPLQENFLGGKLANYTRSPWFWAWGNFDGEHYMTIAQKGYENLTYFFFPFYPLLMRLFAGGMWRGLSSYLSSGLFVSNISFFIALVGLWKLVRMDYKKRIAELALVLLLLFPTSFYFGAIYTESVFLALVVWSFYSARKRKWWWAGLLAGLSSATRIVGLALIPALLIEYWFANKKKGFFRKDLFFVLLTPLGILLYMFFLKNAVGDPLEFLNAVGVFGEQRSATLVLFPQVFYRYIFKVLPNLNYSSLLLFFAPILEFVMALAFLVLGVLSFYKTRLSYAVYLALGFIIPALSGSFSSFPRYALVLFPGFILGAIYLAKAPRFLQVLVFSLLFMSLGIATAMFTRGYWIG